MPSLPFDPAPDAAWPPPLPPPGLPPLDSGASAGAGESEDSLGLWDQWLAAWQARCIALPSDAPVVVLASYHGGQGLPNLTPLLALALAQQGVRVLVHGLATTPAGASSEAIFHDLGLPACADGAAVQARWSRRQPAYLPAGVLCAGWPRVFALPPDAAARVAGHRLAPWLNPVRGARALRVLDTCASPWLPCSATLARRGAADALLLHGCSGEPVADPRRRPRLQVWLAGEPAAALALPAHEGPLTDPPLLPAELGASPTALYIQAVVGGERPMPEPLAQQLALMHRALQAMAGGPGLPGAAVSG